MRRRLDPFHRVAAGQGQSPATTTRREITWLALMILVVLLIAQTPYVLAHLTAPPDRTFSGSFFSLFDANSYLAAIRQGKAGNWLFSDLYTSEAHQPGPLHLFYTTWGQVAALLGAAPIQIFTAARLVHGCILLVVLYWFLTLIVQPLDQRRIAFLFLAFSSGLGWLLLFLGKSTALGDSPTDLWMPEANTFLTLFIFPHFAAATSLMLLTFGGLLLAFRQHRIVPALGAALASFALAWIHPFLLAPVYAVLATYLAWEAVRRRAVPWPALGQFSLCVVASLPVVAYLQFGVIAPNAAFRGWMDQNAAPSPNVLAYLVGFGLLGPLALIGASQILRNRYRLDLFPLFWIVVGSLLLYLPISTQRRLAEGLHIPLCVLAALGWLHIWHRVAQRRLARSLLAAGLVVGLITSTLFNWYSATYIALHHQPPYFLPAYQLEAMHWLEEHTTWDETVLSSYKSGSYIPAWAGNRVVIGHWAETLHVTEKDRDVEYFFREATPPETRQEIVHKYGVSYLFYGPDEQSLGSYDPGSDPVWEIAFANDRVAVYRLVPEYRLQETCLYD